MIYQLRKTDQGLILYGSEEVKPKRGVLEPSYQLNRRVELYEASFKPICPIYKEREEKFIQLAYNNSTQSGRLEEELSRGINIPSERVEIISVDESYNGTYPKTPIPNYKQYAILLTEKKEEESQDELWEAYKAGFYMDSIHGKAGSQDTHVREKYNEWLKNKNLK